MTIDILLSTYNGAKFVDVQIESLLQQTYPDIHLIIRDDGSKDETPQLLQRWKERYPDKITLYIESNVGVVASFNTLVGYSKAPYLAFCDQDDYWEPHKLETCMQQMDKGKPCLVHSDLKVVDGNLKEIHPSFWGYSYLSGERKYATLPRLLIQNVVTGCTTLFNRELATLAFPAPSDAVMHDWWLALVAACFGTIRAVPSPLIQYRQHGNNTVGALKYALFSNPRPKLARILKMVKHERQRAEQAEQLLERFSDRLAEEEKQILCAFSRLHRQFGLERVKTIVKYKIYKIGWQRNLFHLVRLRSFLLKK